MEKGTLQKAYEKLVLDNLELKEQIAELKAVLKEIAKGKYSTEGHSGWFLAEQALKGE